MNRLREFTNSFANIILGLITALLLSYLFFPEAVWMQKPKRTCDYVLAFGLLIFLIKWLHESSVSEHRFSGLRGNHPGWGWHVFLFLSRVGTPFISLIFVTQLLRRETEGMVGAAALILGTGLLFLHASLYLVPDLYLKRVSPQLPTEDAGQANWNPNKTINHWIAIDILVMFVALLSFLAGGWFKERVTGEYVKWGVGVVMILQTVADWGINWRFFFSDRVRGVL